MSVKYSVFVFVTALFVMLPPSFDLCTGAYAAETIRPSSDELGPGLSHDSEGILSNLIKLTCGRGL